MPTPLDAITAATPLDQLTSDQIKCLQTDLINLGYGLTADGMFGPITAGVWARFKADNGIDQPTLIGPSSVALLEQRGSSAGARNVPAQALAIVKSFEGFCATAYSDGVGVMTIGYGTSIYPGGLPVQAGQTVTQDQALQYLANDLQSTATTLGISIPYWGTMNANQQSCLISFGYNLGAGFYGSPGFNSILSALQTHRWSDVPSVLAIYSDPESPAVHAGLLRRRIAEGELWNGAGPFASAG